MNREQFIEKIYDYLNVPNEKRTFINAIRLSEARSLFWAFENLAEQKK